MESSQRNTHSRELIGPTIAATTALDLDDMRLLAALLGRVSFAAGPGLGIHMMSVGPRYRRPIPLTHRRVHALIIEVSGDSRVSDSVINRTHAAMTEVAANCASAAEVAAICRQEVEIDDLTDLIEGIASDEQFEAKLAACVEWHPVNRSR